MGIIQQIFQFITFKREVKDIDYNQSLAYSLIAANIFINHYGMQLLVEHIQPIQEEELQTAPLYVSILQNLIYAGLFFALFKIQEVEIRFVQAATAYFGVSVLLVPFGIAFIFVPGLQIISIALFFLILVCSVRVLMQALEFSIGLSIAALLGINLLALVLSSIFVAV